jgi:hypothetical protein
LQPILSAAQLKRGRTALMAQQSTVIAAPFCCSVRNWLSVGFSGDGDIYRSTTCPAQMPAMLP